MALHSSNPRISIIIPVLNGEKTLEKAIQSVLQQHYDNVEMIILDGASQDATVAVIKRYEAHIDYWHSQPDKGSYPSTNEGIQRATGDFIGMLMADDWYEPGTFQALAQAVAVAPDSDIVSFGGRVVTHDPKQGNYKEQLVYRTMQALDLNFYNICFAVSAICSRFIRRELYEKIGLFEAFDRAGKYIISADKEFLLRTVLHGAKNTIVNHLGHTYLAHPGSTTYSKNQPNLLRLYQEHRAIAEDYLKKSNLTVEQRRTLEKWYADQYIRYSVRSLLKGQVRCALQSTGQGMKELKLRWLFALMSTLWAIIKK